MRRASPGRRGSFTRRALLTALGATPLALAGCLGTGGSGSDGTATPSATARPGATPTPTQNVETYAWNGAPNMEPRNAAYPQGSVGPYFVAALRSAEEATSFSDASLGGSGDGTNKELAQAATFLSDTDYGQRSVIAIQDQKSSSHPDLELDRVVPVTVDDATGVHVHARYPGGARTADVIEDTLLVRVPGDPAFALATLTPQYGEPVTFATANALGVPVLDDPRALVVRNLDCTDHVVGVRGVIDGTLVTIGAVEAPAGSIRVVDGVFRYDGTYAVEASIRTLKTSTSAEVPVSADDPRNVFVGIDGSAGLSISRVDGRPAERRIECEPEQRPYESSDPARNVDEPVDLWVVSKDPDPRTLTVTIRDGDTRVFRQTFDLAGGDDKRREADLLAKKGTYTLTVDPASGSRIERTVEVRDGVEKLTVHVAESGRVEIVAN